MSSASYFNLDRSKILSSGNGLMNSFPPMYTLSQCFRLIDCMVFNVIFNSFFSYIAPASVPVNAFLEFFNRYSVHYSFQAAGCFPT